jgi:hypothetical protein
MKTTAVFNTSFELYHFIFVQFFDEVLEEVLSAVSSSSKSLSSCYVLLFRTSSSQNISIPSAEGVSSKGELLGKSYSVIHSGNSCGCVQQEDYRIYSGEAEVTKKRKTNIIITQRSNNTILISGEQATAKLIHF